MKTKLAMIIALVGVVMIFACGEAKKTDTSTSVKPSSSGGQMSGEVLARINDEVITLAEFDEQINRTPHYARVLSKSPEKKREYLDQQITQRLLLDEAKRKGFDKDPEIEKRIEDLKARLITEKVMKEVIEKEAELTDEDLEKYYEENKDEFARPAQVRASHILIDVKPDAEAEQVAEASAKAETVLREVKAGGDFAELAKKYSGGPTSRRGGDLGYFSKGRMAPEFDEAVFALANIDDVSDIVKTQFGFHIIKLTGKKEAQQQTFEQAKRRIEARLKQEQKRDRYKDYVDGLKASARIEINEELLAVPAEEAEPQSNTNLMDPGK